MDKTSLCMMLPHVLPFSIMGILTHRFLYFLVCHSYMYYAWWQHVGLEVQWGLKVKNGRLCFA